MINRRSSPPSLGSSLNERRRRLSFDTATSYVSPMEHLISCLPMMLPFNVSSAVLSRCRWVFSNTPIFRLLGALPDRIWCNGQHCRLSRGSSGFDSPYPNYVFVLLGSIHHPSSLNLNLFFASDITVPEELRIRSRGIWKTQVILRLTMFHQGMCGSNICIVI